MNLNHNKTAFTTLHRTRWPPRISAYSPRNLERKVEGAPAWHVHLKCFECERLLTQAASEVMAPSAHRNADERL